MVEDQDNLESKRNGQEALQRGNERERPTFTLAHGNERERPTYTLAWE